MSWVIRTLYCDIVKMSILMSHIVYEYLHILCVGVGGGGGGCVCVCFQDDINYRHLSLGFQELFIIYLFNFFTYCLLIGLIIR